MTEDDEETVDSTNQPPESSPENGGSGGKTARTESGRTELQDARLTGLAVRRGWVKGPRWAMDRTPEQIVAEAAEQGRLLTVKERIVVSVGTDVLHADPRVRGIACRTGVAMEGQNQDDEHLEAKAPAPPPAPAVNVTINSGSTAIQVVQREDFYGNDAHSRFTPTAGAPETLSSSSDGPALPGAVQATGVRPTLGEDGDGADGHHERTRPGPGDAQGGD